MEERLGILQSARLPVLHQASFAEEQDELSLADVGGEELEGDRSGSKGGSRLEGMEMKGLNAAQRKKVMLLRGKRDRLEKEKARLDL